ncbi:MAG TPA: heparan-alpha-glucosaminide N-acetyltransferase domain-containing protein [Puia sp.]|nr:heparan-alpha-glucosaminide N-acetyltransferase domain-containing protein [Puia sp.]
MKRIYSIDFTRGLVMIIMALDHVRDLLHVSSVTQRPTDLTTTTPILFFTRWVTYLCAPIFVFLAGTSAYLSFKSRGNLSESRKFLLKRGLWIVLLEFSAVNFALFFDAGFHTLIFEVIGAIGFGFIILSLLLKSSLKTICITGLIIIFFYGLLPLTPGSTINTILSLLFSSSAFTISSSHVFIMGYPPIPWLGIMLVGFAAGKLFELPGDQRKKIFIRIGLGSLLLFIFLRFINVFGDPFPWSSQKDSIFSFLSFINISKYPPSLLFCLVTLGIMFLVLAFAERENRFTPIVLVYGKVPLFYFVLHFYIIHILLLIILFFQGIHWSEMTFATGTFGRPVGKESGLALWVIYIIWIAIVTLLYIPCNWFGKYKSGHHYWWLRYL